MNKIITLATAILLVSCAEVPTKEKALSLNAGGFTHHFKERKGNKDWNQTHNNIGLEYEFDRTKTWRKFVGHEQFKNSFGDRGSLTSGGVKYCYKGAICAPLGVGYFTGYKNTTFTPYAGLEYNFGRFTLRTAIAPAKAEQGNKTGFAFIGGRIKIMEW